MNQIYHHYTEWEEHHAGMWVAVTGKRRKMLISRAIRFTGNAALYGEYMIKVLDRWPISCEQNLSVSNSNRQAWIGHAATCIAIGCPEEITRCAWHYLTKEQQDEANLMADRAIARWEQANEHKRAEPYQYILTELYNA